MAAREAQGLRQVVLVRLAYVLVFAPGDLAFVRTGVDLFFWFLVLGVFVGVSLLFIRQLRRRSHVDAVGLSGALLDVLIVGAGVATWTKITGSAPAVWAHGSMLPMAAMLTIAINGLALRPRYPIIVSSGILAIMIGSLIVGLRDPRTVISARLMELRPGPDELSLGLYGGALLMVAATGAVTVILTWISRKTVHRAVRLERFNTSLAESQVEVVVEEKIAALTQLAAGVSHELNTPLGAISSTTETTARLAAKVRELLEREDSAELGNAKLRRALRSLEASTKLSLDAGERIGRVVETLRQFVRLDESERKTVDLRDVIEETLSLLRHQLGPRIRIETRYGDLPPLTCNPGRLSQVFYTVLRNAAESIEGQGTISIVTRVDDDAIEIEIADSGRGIPPERLEGLFDVRFSEDRSGARVHAAMGLPISRSVIRRHGGSISVRSAVGEGTTFTIRLPRPRPR